MSDHGCPHGPGHYRTGVPQTPPALRGAKRPRGLPAYADLAVLAETYLKTQRRLWPELADAGLLEAPTQAAIERLVEQFTSRFREQTVVPFGHEMDSPPWRGLGASYVRYSDKGQNRRSLDDQLVLQLERARRDGVFVPWAYVWADAAVTATHANRRGYQLAKETLLIEGPGEVEVLFMDEIARGTREAIETFRLGNLVKQRRKRLVGASDHFDSEDSSATLRLHVAAMLHEQETEERRYRVKRGQQGAAKRGAVVGTLPVGIKAVPLLDGQGRAVVGSRDRPLMTYALDEEWGWVVELLAELFLERRWLLTRIAKEFNDLRVAGRRTWSAKAVKDMLGNHTYVGIRITNRKSFVTDPETGQRRAVANPRSEWVVKRMPHLQVWPWKTWKAIQARLAEITHAAPGRKTKGVQNRLYPTTLLSGLLVCGTCGSPLTLYRGGAVNPYFFCYNGRENRYGCNFKGCKRVALIEESLLDCLRQELLGEEQIRRLVERANEFLAEEAQRPLPDAGDLKRWLRVETQRQARLLELVEGDASADLAAARSRLKALAKGIKQLRQEIREIESQQGLTFAPISAEAAVAAVADLRELLNTDITRAAPVLRELLGPVRVFQRRVPGRRRREWLAEVRCDLVPILTRLAGDRQSPGACSWATLHSRNWSFWVETSVPLQPLPQYQRFAPEVHQLSLRGLTLAQIGEELGISKNLAGRALQYARRRDGRAAA